MSDELYFVYGLIVVVIALIIFIIVMDKKESKKKNKNLFDTLNMKIITDSSTIQTEENSSLDIETVEIKSDGVVEEFDNLQPIKEVDVVSNDILDEVNIDESYVETDLEKTQAQIRVEEITKALEKAEKQDKDKYEIFEEEQEKNAIISYNELKKSFDKLYSENEKIQYLEDDEIPINIEELYKIKETNEESNKVELKDLSDIKKSSQTTSTFKNSPYISPVYGIQEPPIETKRVPDIEIESANQFLQTLKELKNNLD